MFRPAGNLISLRPWNQPRTTVVNNTTIIDRGCGGHHCGSNRGFWTAFGVTAGLGLFANIAGAIWGNGGQQQVSNNYQYSGYMPGFMPGTDYASFNRYTNPGTQTTNTQGQDTPQSTLSNLNKFYKDYTWIYQDGQFYGKNNKTGETTEGFSSFEDVNSFMSAKSAKEQNPVREVNRFTESEAKGIITGAGLGDKITIEDGEITYTINGKTYTADLTEQNLGKAVAAFTTTVAGSDDTPSGTPGQAAGNGGADPTATPTGGSNPTAAPTGAGAGRIKVPDNWERIATSERNVASNYTLDANARYNIDGEQNITDRNDIEHAQTAEEVAAYLLYTEMNMPTPMTIDKNLIDEIIKYNPSVFNKDGSVKDNADWKKLDLPNREYLEAKGYISKNNSTAANDATVQNNNTNETANWSIKSSPSPFSNDAYITGANGTIYNIETDDGCDLNMGKFKIENNTLTTSYKGIKYIREKDGDGYLPARRTNNGNIEIQVNNKWIKIEEFLNNPDKYKMGKKPEQEDYLN